jgi:hypothetical protein
MAREISLIADQVLPESPLPDAAFAARHSDGAEPFLLRQRFGKTALDQAPAGREIAIVRWQGPDRVEMIGQDDERVYREGMTLPGRGDCLAQRGDMIDEQSSASLQQVDREEEASAWNERATIVRHAEQNSTFALPIVEVEAADYAFGSNPPYGLPVNATA